MLCLSCGLCCSGAVFARVPLETTDSLTPLQAGGIPVQRNEKRHYFTLPCAAHRHDGGCQVYADRPGMCRAYRCEVLKKFDRGGTSWAEAQQRIGRLRMLKETLAAELARVLPDGGRLSVPEARELVPAQAALAADPELLKRWAPVLLRLSALIDEVRTHFQPRAPDETRQSA